MDPHFCWQVCYNGKLWYVSASVINYMYQLLVLQHQLVVLQAKLFYINLLLTQNLDQASLSGTEFFCYPILQLIKCVAREGNQVKANNLHSI